MAKERGFEVVKKFENQNISLPKRQTEFAAGYDIEAATDFVVPAITNDAKPVLVPTGLKAYMQPDEVLLLFNRSSNPMKRNLILPNSVGVIDADYYNNENNEGEIFVQMQNVGNEDFQIKKGDRIVQGIFIKYLTTDDDNGGLAKRSGGFGSSGIN